MIFLIVINAFLFIGYLLFITWIIRQWDKIEEVRFKNEYDPIHQFSIIVPFRNEIACLKQCIDSLQSLNYCKKDYEIIVINDNSTDGSEKLLMNSNVCLINAKLNGKKNAISEGIMVANFPWIITVDADCTFDNDWLRIIDQAININKCDVLVGAVKIEETKGVLNSFQFMDFVSTMAITAVGIYTNMFHLCNGANFIYRRDLFDAVNGYDGNSKIASGDDVFLINKFANLPDITISFLKSDRGSAITKSETSFNTLYEQRKRWATKTGSYAKSIIITLQGVIFIFSLVILLDILFLPLIFGLYSFVIGCLMLLCKLIIDFFYLSKMVRYYKGIDVMKSYLVASFLYLFYIIFMGLTALFPTSIEWKNRKV